ncbi:MAG: preprotein translocase subunit SecA, partial [Clostridiales bacterium]|nr:preprotein translocase subunit SecA [Clostridiales bacterium]
MFDKLKSVFGIGPDTQLKPLKKIADSVEALEPSFQKLSDHELAAKTEEFRRRHQDGGETLDQLLPEAFATVREAARRTLGMRPFYVQ